MALPTGTFSRGASGPLQLSFSAQFEISTDIWSPGDNKLILQGSVTDGTNIRSVPLSPESPTGIVDWDYVAGTTLTCSMTKLFHSTSTTGTVAASRLRIRAIYMKR